MSLVGRRMFTRIVPSSMLKKSMAIEKSTSTCWLVWFSEGHRLIKGLLHSALIEWICPGDVPCVLTLRGTVSSGHYSLPSPSVFSPPCIARYAFVISSVRGFSTFVPYPLSPFSLSYNFQPQWPWYLLSKYTQSVCNLKSFFIFLLFFYLFLLRHPPPCLESCDDYNSILFTSNTS